MKLFVQKQEPFVSFRGGRGRHVPVFCLVVVRDHRESEGSHGAGHWAKLHCRAIKGITGAQSLATVPTVIIMNIHSFIHYDIRCQVKLR